MKVKRPLVSVVIPAYNAEKYLRETLESAIAQTYAPLEILLVDDGSSDSTLEIAASFGEAIKVYPQKNQGIAAARNNGVKLARGEWIAFLDSDDIWLPGKIEAQLANASGLVWSHTDYVFFGTGQSGIQKSSETAPKYGGEVFSKMAILNFIGTSTVMVRRDVFLKSGGFDLSLRAIQDWDLWIRIASEHELGYVPEVLAKYRVHHQSISRRTRVTLPNHLKVIEKTFSSGGPGQSHSHLKSQALACSYSICSLIASQNGDMAFSLYCALKALRYQPFNPAAWKSLLRILLKDIPIRLFNKTE